MANKNTLATLVLLHTGCGLEAQRPATTEELARLQQTLVLREAATSFAQSLALQMKTGTLDAEGNPATPETLAEALGSSSRWLQTVVDDERVMVGQTTDVSSAIAEYDANATGTYRDDSIVVSDNPDSWELETLMHEAGHKRFSSHDSAFQAKLNAEGADISDRSFAQDIIAYHDYAYLLSALCMYPSVLEAMDREKITKAMEEADENARGLGLVARRTLVQELELNEEETQEAVKDWFDARREHYETYGLSEENFVDAYWESGLHEARLQSREAALSEFDLEHRESMVEIAPRNML